MKEKIKAAITTLRGTDNTTERYGFKHQAKGLHKSLSGEVFINPTGLFAIQLTSIEGYNEKYAQKITADALQEAVLPYPKKGDIVWTLLDSDFTPGQTYPISGDTYYYGVGTSLLNCNGRRFYEEVTGAYLKKELGICSASASNYYTLFKLT